MIKTIIGIICAVGLIVYYIVINRKGLYKKIDSSTSKFDDEQKLYQEHQTPAKYLSADEKLELSWQFIYKIAEQVYENFSKQDRDSVHHIGKTLTQGGMRYIHVIDNTLRSNKDVSKTIKEQDVGKSQKQKSW